MKNSHTVYRFQGAAAPTNAITVAIQEQFSQFFESDGQRSTNLAVPRDTDEESTTNGFGFHPLSAPSSWISLRFSRGGS